MRLLPKLRMVLTDGNANAYWSVFRKSESFSGQAAIDGTRMA